MALAFRSFGENDLEPIKSPKWKPHSWIGYRTGRNKNVLNESSRAQFLSKKEPPHYSAIMEIETATVTHSAATALTAAAATTRAFVSSLSNTHLIGSAWILSSTILTTYSTTSFLKYNDSQGIIQNDNSSRYKPKGVSRSGNNIMPSSVSRPALLTLYRFSGSLLLGLIARVPVLDVISRVRQTLGFIHHFSIPAAFLFIANFSNSVAIDRIGISLTYTSKCGIPLITVILTLLLDGVGALPSVPALLSLVLIAAGIAAASWNHPTFEAIGFTAAIISCVAQVALNVSSKKVMTETKITGPDAQRAMVAVALAITAAMSTLNHIWQATKDHAALEGEGASMITMKKTDMSIQGQPPFWLAGIAVLSYHIEYILSFMFVILVKPITFGTCDAIRRLTVIISGHHMFGEEPFTKLNIFGISLALCGALGYAIS